MKTEKRAAGQRELRLHGGVHKTGSTYLQLHLRANRRFLRQNGIAVYDPLHLRPVTSHFFRSRAPALTEEKREMLKAMLAERIDMESCRTTLLSQENMIGIIENFAGRQRLYPTARGVLTNFAAILPRRATSFHLCIRDFASFLPSAYIEYIRGNPFIPFSAFVARLDLDRISWLPLVRAFGTAFKGAEADVFTYSAFKSDPDGVVNRMLGKPLAARLQPARNPVVRPSASSRVVEELTRISAADGPDAALAAMRDLENAFPAGAEWPRFDPWTEDQKARLKRRYAEDLDKLDRLKWVRLTQ